MSYVVLVHLAKYFKQKSRNLSWQKGDIWNHLIPNYLLTMSEWFEPVYIHKKHDLLLIDK